MKKLAVSIVSTLSASICAFGMAACSSGNAKQLGAAATAESLSYWEFNDEGLFDIRLNAEAFASDFAAATYDSMGGNGNFVVAPVSVYMALSVAAECAAGDTREEILTALDIDYTSLKTDFSKLYRSLIAEYRTNTGGLEGQLTLTNSIWLNSGMNNLNVKDECISSLSQNFYCYSYSADFTNNNKQANRAVKSFVKKQTNGLINRDFNISSDSSFVLLNTLYLKNIWNMYGTNLPFTSEKYNFVNSDGSKNSTKLLQGKYSVGRAYEEETFTNFYARTYNGYQLKFIVPKEGYSVDDVYTSENLAKVSALTDYNALDDENMLCYNTRCLFPEFSASFNGDVKNVLREAFGINSMFDFTKSDFSSISDSPNYCTSVQHVTNLKVTKKGIEGAAVTVIPGAGAAAPGEYTNVYEDFVVDRSFAFIITDSHNTTIFSGVVNKI